MPQSKSAKKALRKSIRRHSDNLKRKKTFRETLKEFSELISAGKFSDAEKLLPKAYKSLDKAAKKSTIHKNTANRKKSRITLMLNKAKNAKK